MDFNTNFSDKSQQPELNNPIMEFAQELDLVFNVKKYELSCDIHSGKMNLDEIIFNRSFNNTKIEKLLRVEIDQYTEGSSLFNYEINIDFANGTVRDIVLVSTKILNNNGEDINNIYIFR